MGSEIQPPIIIVGCFRSGTTVFRDALFKAVVNSVVFDQNDFEMRSFWQLHGLQLGTPKSGTYCHPAYAEDVTDSVRKKVRRAIGERAGSKGVLIGKSPHLSNKIGYVHECIPNAKFIHIVRECYATCASTKLHIERLFEGHNYHNVPFQFYWPEGERACWSAVPVAGYKPNGPKRTLLQKLLLRNLPMKGAIAHVNGSEFRERNSDRTRYYPGEGFKRIPESWVTINCYIAEQLRELPNELHTTVTYESLCENTQEVLAGIERHFQIDMNLTDTEQLSKKSINKWRKILSDEERLEIDEVVRAQSLRLETLGDVYPACVAQP